jgi:pyridinium-3,5-bisthiocarboxylic acid mononucleotide nickel chelatase
MKKIAYFDCFGGISGDMALGALVDAGADAKQLEAVVDALSLADEVRVGIAREQRGHLAGTRVTVEVGGERARTFPELEHRLASADAPEGARSRALEALRLLGTAESELHGTPVAQLHLHELGGADTLVDLLGTFWLLESLDVEHVYSSPLPAPRGWRGEMPLPAPAALRVLAGTGAVLDPADDGRELVTPTGAAILAAAAVFERPSLQLLSIGYGFGAHPAAGNALAVWLGESGTAVQPVEVLETNVDDMTPADLSVLAEELLTGGALDVTITPTLMKKGRPAHILAVICTPEKAGALAELVMARSTTLGLRITRTPRVTAERDIVDVDTPLGRARVKVKRWGAAVQLAPEQDDLRALAAASGRDVRDIRRLVEAAARAQLGLDP